PVNFETGCDDQAFHLIERTSQFFIGDLGGVLDLVAFFGEGMDQVLVNFGGDNDFSHDIYRIFQVRLAKSVTESCSARLSKKASLRVASSKRGRIALRKVFRRWLKAVFTKRKKLFSSRRAGAEHGVRRITALLTL